MSVEGIPIDMSVYKFYTSDTKLCVNGPGNSGDVCFTWNQFGEDATHTPVAVVFAAYGLATTQWATAYKAKNGKEPDDSLSGPVTKEIFKQLKPTLEKYKICNKKVWQDMAKQLQTLFPITPPSKMTDLVMAHLPFPCNVACCSDWTTLQKVLALFVAVFVIFMVVTLLKKM